eukprot:1780036-Amphidinium_carterae.1
MLGREPPGPQPRRAHVDPWGHQLEHLGQSQRLLPHPRLQPLTEARCRACLPQPDPLQWAGCGWAGGRVHPLPPGGCKKRAHAKANLCLPCARQKWGKQKQKGSRRSEPRQQLCEKCRGQKGEAAHPAPPVPQVDPLQRFLSGTPQEDQPLQLLLGCLVTAHPLHLNVADGGLDAVFDARVPSPRPAGAKLQLVRHYRGTLAINCQHPGSGYESLVVSPETPQPHLLWAGSAGCLPLPSVKSSVSVVVVSGGSAGGASLSGNWMPNPYVWTQAGIPSLKTPTCASLRCCAKAGHSKTTCCGVPRPVWQKTHSGSASKALALRSFIHKPPHAALRTALEGWSLLAARILMALSVGPCLAGSDHKVVRILPPNRSTWGVETFRRRCPPQAIAERPKVAHGASAGAPSGGLSPLSLRRRPDLACLQSSLPGADGVEIKGDLRVRLDAPFKSQFKFRSPTELRPFAQGASCRDAHL